MRDILIEDEKIIGCYQDVRDHVVFTTFSTFSKEGLMMLQAGNFMSLMAYVAISVIAGIALVAAGYYLVRL